MFIRRENFKQFIKLYPVVSLIIAINFIIYILTIPSEMKDIHYLTMVQVLTILIAEW